MDQLVLVGATVAGVVFVAFCFVIFFGAPFLPTLRKEVPRAFDLLNLGPGQTLLELGSGDGRVLIAAAQRGLNAVGYEINPLLVVYSWLLTRKYRTQIKIIWGNYWHKPLPPADGIFVFLLTPYMERLNNKIIQEARKPVKLVSFAFKIDSRESDKSKKGMYLYLYK